MKVYLIIDKAGDIYAAYENKKDAEHHVRQVTTDSIGVAEIDVLECYQQDEPEEIPEILVQ